MAYLGQLFNLDPLIILDSNSLFDTIITLHENREYLLQQTVQFIRNIFESRDLLVIIWVQRLANMADALTKRNLTMHILLDCIFNDGELTIPSHEFHDVNSADWI